MGILRVGAPRTLAWRSCSSMSVGAASSQWAASRVELILYLVGGQEQRGAPGDGAATAGGAHRAERADLRVARDDRHRPRRPRRAYRRTVGRGTSGGRSEGADAGEGGHAAITVHDDARALEAGGAGAVAAAAFGRPDARRLHVGRQTDADIASLGARASLLRCADRRSRGRPAPAAAPQGSCRCRRRAPGGRAAG